MWSVFRLPTACSASDRAAEADRGRGALRELAAEDVVVRGIYDVAGLRADADVMIWWHADDRRAAPGGLPPASGAPRSAGACAPVWSQMALHRPAEFNKSHVPAFLADEEPRGVRLRLPVRALLRLVPARPTTSAARMLAEHGRWPASYPDVRANTVSAFALGDYEWILAFEADELHRIVDLMRDLRASEARRHVREEVPFYTGRRTCEPGRPRRATCPARQPGARGLVRRAPGVSADRVDAVALVGRACRSPRPRRRARGGEPQLAQRTSTRFMPERAVLDVLDRSLGQRRVERRPAAVRVELRVAAEQLGAAGPAAVDAPVLVSVYSPVNARSVPALRSTSYSCGVTAARATRPRT